MNSHNNSDKILSKNLEEIRNMLQNNKIKICVVGIGRIGLPTALSFANSGLATIGVDIRNDLVDMINSGNYPLKDEPHFDSIFNNVLNNKKFFATTNIEEAVPKSDVIVLSLPTPMDENNVPDYSALKSVAKQLSEIMLPDSLIIVESTVEPGFIEDEFVKIVESSGRLIASKNFGIGVCPETANPGAILQDFEKLPRLVGATDEQTTDVIMAIYNHVFPVELIRMPNCKTANAVKLTTNVFRDINIAYINELALLFEKLGIDTLQVLKAAKTKYNFQIHYPGAGVGGPCLPVNSYQMLNSANKFDDISLDIVKSSRKINEKMPYHVIDLLKDGLAEAGKQIISSKILILGISYKPDVKDIQLTPAKVIVEKLKEIGVEIKIYDPYFKSNTVFDIETESNLEDAVSNIDAVMFITGHKEFQLIEPGFLAAKMNTKVVIDTRGVMNYHEAKKAGLIFRGLGIGRT